MLRASAQSVLEVAERDQRPEVDAERRERLRHGPARPGEDAARAEDLHRIDDPDEVIGGGGIDDVHAGDVDDHEPALPRLHLVEEALHHVGAALRVDDADHRQREDVVPHLEHRGG